MVDVQQQSSCLQSCKRTASSYRLSSYILNSLARVKPNYIVFIAIKTLDQLNYSNLWDLPNSVCLLVIKLSSGVEKELSKGSNSFSSHFLILIFGNFSE